MPQDMPEIISEYMPDRVPERMSERMSEDMPDRMSEDAALWCPSARLRIYIFLSRAVEYVAIYAMVGIIRSEVFFFFPFSFFPLLFCFCVFWILLICFLVFPFLAFFRVFFKF